MKYQYSTAAIAALCVSSVSAWGPGGFPGGWPSCANSCSNKGNWGSDAKSWCSSSDNINSANSCVSSSSCSDSDKELIYQFIATLCVDAGVTVTATPQATFSITSGAPYPWQTTSISGYGPWGTNSDWTTWTTKSGWNSGHPFGPGGWGPWGPSNWGPSSGPWSDSAWRSGPWTAWWGTSGCPASTWSGWTSGPWGTSAPWTSWKGCSATTTATTVVTTTLSGGQTTVTTNYGIQVAQATGSATSGGSASAASATTGAAGPAKTAGMGVALGAAFLGVAAAL